MVWNWCVFNRNSTSNFDFSLFCGLVIYSMILSQNTGQQQWASIPSQPCDHKGKYLIVYSVLCAKLWCLVWRGVLNFNLYYFQFLIGLFRCSTIIRWGASETSRTFFPWPFAKSKVRKPYICPMCPVRASLGSPACCFQLLVA
jgi:hypothetical protein